MKRCKKIRINFLVLLLTVLGILSIGMGISFQKSNNLEEKNILESVDKKVYDNPIPALRYLYQNDDIVAELNIPSLDFKELVVKAKDNDFYLTHNIQKDEDKCGATFIDYRIKDIDNAKQINIYGHNSDYYNLPFKILENYQEETFFYENLDITLNTEKASHSYKIFAVSTIPKESDEHMVISYEKEDFLKHVVNMRANSTLDTKEVVKENDAILIIQTCLFDPDRYLLLLAKKIK